MLGFVGLLVGIGMAIIQIDAYRPNYLLAMIYIGASVNSIILCYVGEAVIDNADINQRLLKHFNPEDGWFYERFTREI